MNTCISLFFLIAAFMLAFNTSEAQFVQPSSSFSSGGGFQNSGRRGQFFRGGFHSGPDGVSGFGGGGSFSSQSTSSGAIINTIK